MCIDTNVFYTYVLYNIIILLNIIRSVVSRLSGLSQTTVYLHCRLMTVSYSVALSLTTESIEGDECDSIR